jgi:arginine utilization regulatory protein
LEEILKHAIEPIFVLNERGDLVWSNPAFDRALGYSSLSPADQRLLQATFLRPPVDLPPGTARSVSRPIGDGPRRSWWTITFLHLQASDADPLAFIGQMTPGRAPQEVPSARDGVAIEQLALLAERQRMPPVDRVLVAKSPGMKRVVEQLLLAAGSDVPVSIIGEEGVGKRLVAQLIRSQSEQSTTDQNVEHQNRGAATIDCRLLNPEVQREQFLDITRISIESIHRDEREGGFPILDDPRGGTLIIHGAAHLAIDLQEKLVQMSGARATPLWRLILTEREQPERIRAEGKWSEEFFQLATRLVIPIPPLRERPADLELLVMQILARPDATNAHQERVGGIEPAALAKLRLHDFPGNVAELEQIVRRALRKGTKPTLTERDLPRFLGNVHLDPIPWAEGPPLPSLNQVLESVERRMIELALRRHRGNKSKAARELGISRPRLHRRAKELGFEVDFLEENPVPEENDDEDLRKEERF